MTQITMKVPDDVARKLKVGGRSLARRALEALAVEAYRTGEITAAQVQQMLGLSSRWETEAFLKERKAYLHYTETDLDADLQTVRQVAPSY